MICVGWIPTRQISSGPVDVKDLLNECSLGMFGDRYSHLMHELQVINYVVFEVLCSVFMHFLCSKLWAWMSFKMLPISFRSNNLSPLVKQMDVSL